MLDIIEREFTYVSYYFMVQLRQIFIYWVLGIRHFLLYLAFVMVFSLLTGMIVNLPVQLSPGIQLSRRCVVTKARSRAPALRPRLLRPYVSAALCSERKRGRRDNTPP